MLFFAVQAETICGRLRPSSDVSLINSVKGLERMTEISEGLSERARTLLAREEDCDVDFKRLAQLDSEDIVAFANSATGGAVLLGVAEGEDALGRQVGIVEGCDVGDRARQAVIAKAQSCVPPVHLEVHTETDGERSFFRVEISSGPHKPYCTQGGTYKIRGDGQNLALRPKALLLMFLEAEGQEFLGRFREATVDLEHDLRETRFRLLASVDSMERQITEELGSVFGAASDATDLSDQAMMLSDEAAAGVSELLETTKLLDVSATWLSGKIDALLDHFAIEDPRLRKAREYVEAKTIELWGQGLNEKEIEHAMGKDWEYHSGPASQMQWLRWTRDKLALLTEGSTREE